MKQNRYQNKSILPFICEASLTKKVGFYVFLHAIYRIRFRNCNFEVLETKHWNWSIESPTLHIFIIECRIEMLQIATTSVCNRAMMTSHDVYGKPRGWYKFGDVHMHIIRSNCHDETRFNRWMRISWTDVIWVSYKFWKRMNDHLLLLNLDSWSLLCMCTHIVS